MYQRYFLPLEGKDIGESQSLGMQKCFSLALLVRKESRLVTKVTARHDVVVLGSLEKDLGKVLNKCFLQKCTYE